MRLPVAIGVVLVLSCMPACSRPPTTSSNTTTTTTPQRGILAVIGDQTITIAEFRRLYRAAGGHKTPKQFLKAMVEEKLLLLEARQRGLARASNVVNATRRALAQSTLKVSFSKWFRPKDVGLLELRKAYKDNRAKYSRPELLFAWHALARVPGKKFDPKGLTPARQKELARRRELYWKGAKRIANEALSLVLKARPTNANAFAAVLRPLIAKYNLPDPKIMAWSQHLVQQFIKTPPSNGKDVVAMLDRAIHEISQKLACINCPTIRYYYRQMKKRWSTKRFVTPKMFAGFLIKFSSHAKTPRERFRINNLSSRGPFAHENMVKSFADAVFALKNLSYSRSLTKSPFGYHVIFRQRSLPAINIPFQKAIPELRKRLFTQQRTVMFRKWLKLLYEKKQPKRFLGRLKKK